MPIGIVVNPKFHIAIKSVKVQQPGQNRMLFYDRIDSSEVRESYVSRSSNGIKSTTICRIDDFGSFRSITISAHNHFDPLQFRPIIYYTWHIPKTI